MGMLAMIVASFGAKPAPEEPRLAVEKKTDLPFVTPRQVLDDYQDRKDLLLHQRRRFCGEVWGTEPAMVIVGDPRIPGLRARLPAPASAVARARARKGICASCTIAKVDGLDETLSDCDTFSFDR